METKPPDKDPRELRGKVMPRGLGRVDAADFFGVSPTTFDKMIADGLAPKPLRIYARKIWDRHALERAFDALQQDEPDDFTPNPFDDIVA